MGYRADHAVRLSLPTRSPSSAGYVQIRAPDFDETDQGASRAAGSRRAGPEGLANGARRCTVGKTDSSQPAPPGPAPSAHRGGGRHDGEDPDRDGRRGRVPGGALALSAAARGGLRGAHRGAGPQDAALRRPRLRGRLRHLHREARLHLARRPVLRRGGAGRVRRPGDPGRPGAGVPARRRRAAEGGQGVLRRGQARGPDLPRPAADRRHRQPARAPGHRLPGPRSRHAGGGGHLPGRRGRRGRGAGSPRAAGRTTRRGCARS